MIGFAEQLFDGTGPSAVRTALASMLLILAAPALAGPEASGRIGVSLTIPPRVAIEAPARSADSGPCLAEGREQERLRVVDAAGRTLRACRNGDRPSTLDDDSGRRVLITPV